MEQEQLQTKPATIQLRVLPEATRVVVPDRPRVPEGLQERVRLQQLPLHGGVRRHGLQCPVVFSPRPGADVVLRPSAHSVTPAPQRHSNGLD